MLLLVSLVLVASPTMAQDAPQIDRIEQLVRSADFAAAETQAQAALASGKLKRRDVARTYLQLGIVATAKRADDPAQAAFRRALALEPSLTLPDSAGPHIGEAFDQAKAVMARSPRLAVSAHLTEVPNRPAEPPRNLGRRPDFGR